MKSTDFLFLARHAAYDGEENNPALSEYGKKQAEKLAACIEVLLCDEKAVIWSSPAARARETAEIVAKVLGIENIIFEEKLWSDNRHRVDLSWFKEKINSFNDGNLIVISHLEYVQNYPRLIGHPQNNSGYASGVRIRNGGCMPLN